MSGIEVKSLVLTEIIQNLQTGEWLAPEFQRDFVWNTNQIIGLVNSILEAKPIGMATLWEQEDESDLPLEHLSIADDFDGQKNVNQYFGKNSDRPGRYYAILDGKQRSTAIAMVFGGFKATSGSRRYSGSYFLNTDYEDLQDRVVYKSKNEVKRDGLDNITSYVRNGLFPLAIDGADLTSNFFKYTNAVSRAEHYVDNELPDIAIVDRRSQVLQDAFNGIRNTRLAVYIVPKEETLSEICDIFETLNTTGTRVSTVDLIHSWVYAETSDDPEPIRLRDYMDALSEYDGLRGWPSSGYRPEVIAQIVASIQIALDKKHPPRAVSGKKETKINSIKSSDLLAISSSSWRDFFEEQEFVAGCFEDMQNIVAGGSFTLGECPYPGVVNIYLALRWYLEFDKASQFVWTVEHLNKLFVAFFWRNAFSTRYDQGFMTRVAADVVAFKSFLNATTSQNPDHNWAITTNHWLDKLPGMASNNIMYENIKSATSNGHIKGALRDAGRLLLIARASIDPIDTQIDISEGAHELHHIYPKKWCRDNLVAVNENYIGDDADQNNWVNSASNLMPMSARSNKAWGSKQPSSAIYKFEIKSEDQKKTLERYFISDECLTLMENGTNSVGQFFEARSQLLAQEFKRLLQVT